MSCLRTDDFHFSYSHLLHAAAAAAGIGAAPPLKTSSGATATSAAGTAGHHSPDAAAAASAAFCTPLVLSGSSVTPTGTKQANKYLLEEAASGPVCNAAPAESADTARALHAAVLIWTWGHHCTQLIT